MMKKKSLSIILTLALFAATLSACSSSDTSIKEKDNKKLGLKIEELSIEKSTKGNPILGFDNKGKITYGGDPAALVVGDTVYLYTGNDTSTGNSYTIPQWLSYSSTDMINWTYHGVILKVSDISWARDVNSAWAAQVAKRFDPTTGKDMYYLYFCTWDKTSEGKQSIGVAVSDSPTGPFVDIGQPLVKGTLTTNQTSDWNDIDPTVWIETDKDGVERRYLMWGNGKLYICELNEDMISVKDLNGDNRIEFGVDILEKTPPMSFTEAAWLYRRQKENGNYYGGYYMFYAFGWREQIAYATTDDLMNGTWQFGKVLMEPTATSNTNHMSVIDFKGKTYFIYHNGSLPGGNGYRRVVAVEELKINADGTIDPFIETATGIGGTATIIKDINGDVLSHKPFRNSSSDSFYPYTNVPVGTKFKAPKEEDSLWEIVQGKADPENEYYVSIEAYNKPGLYLTVGKDGFIGLTQDAFNILSKQQTFRTVKGLSGDGVSFESVSQPGYFITVTDNTLALTKGNLPKESTFFLSNK
jgi:hypothetical protein